jgi:hypothetical protein
MTRNSLAVLAVLLAAVVATGCDIQTTLDDLAQRDDVHVESTIARDQCRCQCDTLVCWNLTCSSSRCSIRDEYELRVVHGPDASGECPERPQLTAQLIAGDAAPLAPYSTDADCGATTFTWRLGDGQFDASLPHRVEIADHSATWTIDGAFLARALTLVAPASAASPAAGSAPSLRAGEQLVVAVSPPALNNVPRATIRNLSGVSTAPTLDLFIDAAETDRIAVTIPPDTAPGRHRIVIGLDILLTPEECIGPALCRAADANAHCDLRID